MSLRTEIENDLDWRVTELAALRTVVPNQQRHPIAFKGMLRALVALLYAHYEGFCKNTIRVFLEQICQNGITRGHCHDDLMIFSLEEVLRKFRNAENRLFVQFIRHGFATHLHQAIDFERNKENEIVLCGESNLWPKHLIENLRICGLTESDVSIDVTRIKNLLGRRNEIAHGKSLEIADLKTYEEYEKAAHDVMYSLAIAVIEAFESKKFLAPESW